MTRLDSHRPIAVLMLTGSAGFLSFALLLGLHQAPATPTVLLLSFVLLIGGGFGLVQTRREFGKNAIQRVLWMTVITQLVLILLLPPVKNAPGVDPLVFRLCIGLATVTAASFLPFQSHGLRDARLWILVGLYAAAGVWVINASPNPVVDVHVVQQMGVERFLAGENPYSIRTYPDLYGSGSPIHGPGMAEDGFLTYGFPYPPLSFLMAVPGYALFGDHRYGLLAAMAAATLLIAAIRPGARSTAAALLLLFTPSTFYLIEHAWTEPYAIALLAAVAFMASRSTSMTTVSLGLLAVIKQTLVPVIVLGAFLLATPWRPSARMAILAGAIGLTVSLPLILVNVPDFVESAVTLQVRQPFRPESMTLAAWLSDGVGPAVPTWIAFVALGGTILLAIWRLPRTSAGFAIAVGASYFTFFLLSKNAFANYYSLVLAAVCCAIAVMRIHHARSPYRDAVDDPA